MKTDDLIRALATDTLRQPDLRTTLLLGIVPSLAIAVLAVWLLLGFRSDLATALVTPASVVRILLTGLLGIVATRLALLLARPEGGQSARLTHGPSASRPRTILQATRLWPQSHKPTSAGRAERSKTNLSRLGNNWSCRVSVPHQVRVQSTWHANAKGPFPPDAECRWLGLQKPLMY
jgi:hypothetical protein